MQREVKEVFVHDRIFGYIVELAKATRENEWTELGLSPRGTVALTAMAKACAWLNGREYGSGGHEIGELLAKRTGYAFYDKEKLFEIAKMRGYEKEMQEYLDEQPVDSLLYSIAMNFAEPKKKPYPFKLIEELVDRKSVV